MVFARHSKPAREVVEGRTLRACAIEQQKCLIARSQIREDHRLAVQLLDRRNLTRDEVFNDFLGLVWGHLVPEAHQLGQDPIHVCNDERGVLQIWIDAVAKMCDIALIANVVDQLQVPRDMESHSVWLAGRLSEPSE